MANFGSRYTGNRLADKHDSDMLGRLNRNLDVFLTLVSLSSLMHM